MTRAASELRKASTTIVIAQTTGSGSGADRELGPVTTPEEMLHSGVPARGRGGGGPDREPVTRMYQVLTTKRRLRRDVTAGPGAIIT